MARYVRTDEILKTARDGFHSDFGRSMADLTSLREVIEDTPTAEVVEVRHGRWIINDEDYWTKCSVCEFEYLDEQEHIYNTYRYCPHCGARMDGDDGETV